MLDITQDNHHFILTIDNGPGIAPELRTQVLNRGARIDEQSQGHGLGIVRDIVEHSKGEQVYTRAHWADCRL